jgi:mannose-6-phosphate isomerase-like protein (cupin superfamily)
MHIASIDQITAPLISPTGEVLYELVGKATTSGGASLHSLAHIRIPPGKSSAAHFHKLSEETYYFLAGKARMLLDNKDFILDPGQAFLIQPGEVHQIFNIGDIDLEFLAICAPAWVSEDSYFVV